MESVTQDLLRSDIPIFIVNGTDDDNVPIESADIAAIEFLRHGKSNLTYRVYLYADHGLLGSRPAADGRTEHIDYQKAAVNAVLEWVDTHPTVTP
jgi:dienelactone hydrolase